MRGALHYAAANAAVRAGVADFLTAENWQRLLAARDFQEIETILQQTALSRALPATVGAMESLEKRLRGYLAENFHKPLKFLGGDVRKLLATLWRQFEIENIMVLLRGLHNRIPAARIRSRLISLNGTSEIDWPALAAASSIHRFIDRLASFPHGPHFADPLGEALGEYERRGAVFVLETALELAHLRKLRKRIKALSGSDRRSAETFAGFSIDRRNFLAAYRYRFYFHLSPEDILGYTVPHGGRVTAENIQEIALGAPMEEMARRTWPNLSGLARLTEGRRTEAITDLEVLLDRYLHHMALRALAGDPLSLNIVLAFGVLLQHEIDDLIAVIEGKVLGRSVETLTRYLAGSREPS